MFFLTPPTPHPPKKKKILPILHRNLYLTPILFWPMLWAVLLRGKEHSLLIHTPALIPSNNTFGCKTPIFLSVPLVFYFQLFPSTATRAYQPSPSSPVRCIYFGFGLTSYSLSLHLMIVEYKGKNDNTIVNRLHYLAERGHSNQWVLFLWKFYYCTDAPIEIKFIYYGIYDNYNCLSALLKRGFTIEFKLRFSCNTPVGRKITWMFT